MIRRFLRVCAALAAAMVAILAIQSLNYVLFPPAEGLDPNDPEDLLTIVASMPAIALWMVEFSYLLGSTIGGFVAVKLARPTAMRPAWVVGLVLMVLGALNAMQIPQPLWLTVVSLITFVPAAIAGGTWAVRTTRA